MFKSWIRFEVSDSGGDVYLVSSLSDDNGLIFCRVEHVYGDTNVDACTPFVERCKAAGMEVEVVYY